MQGSNGVEIQLDRVNERTTSFRRERFRSLVPLNDPFNLIRSLTNDTFLACSVWLFCFRCGMDYHAPTECSIIKKWLTKCADDSETANYISAHTKDCPECHICIEKNGGCNHMQCYNCKHDFCWMCLGDWKSHGSEYYECSRYRENPNIAHESVHAQVLFISVLYQNIWMLVDDWFNLFAF